MATRFVDQGGSGTACSATSRCSMQTALSQAQPGDLISLASGTLASPKLYTGSASMIAPPSGKSGTSSAPITVKAEVDGGVLIDGQFARMPVSLTNNHWFVLVGFNARNGTAAVLRSDSSRNVIVRRVVAWDADMTKNSEIFGIHGLSGPSGPTLLEDVAGFGAARKTFQNSFGGDDVTCRRCWGRWEGSTHHGPKMTFTALYNNLGWRCENCIATWWEHTMPESYALSGWQMFYSSPRFFTNFKIEIPQGPFNRDGAQSRNTTCINTKILGSLAYIRAGDRYPYKNVDIPLVNQANGSGWPQGCADVIHTLAVISPAHTDFALRGMDLNSNTDGHPNVASNVTSISGNPPTITSAWSGSSRIHGTSLSAINSKNANPWTGTAGANLCRRWVNGVVTTTPLWDWPMRDRIKAATAMAGAYNGPCNIPEGPCSGGRETRVATDMQADIEALLGPIPSQCKAGSVGTLVLNVSPTTLTFNVTQGGPSDAKTVTVTNSGTGGPMPWSVTKSASLTMVALNPTSRADAGTFTATATAPSSLAAGQYTGTLTVSASGASGSPQVIGVTVNVAASPPPPAPTPTLALSPTSLTFDVVAGGSPVTKGVAVNNTTADSGPMSWSASANQAFVSLSPTSAPDVGTLNVTVNPAELAVGTRSAVVTVQANANNSPQTVGVTVNVAAAPIVAALALSQTAFTFRGQADATLPAQSLTIENSGDGGSIAWTASDNATWLGLSATSGVTPATIQLLVSTLGLAVGTHTATISVASASASNSPQTASVTLIVDPPPAEEEPTEPEVPPEDDPLPEPDPVPPEKPGKGHGRERAPGRLKKLIQSTTSALLVIVGAEGEFMHATLETDVGDEVDDG